MGAILKEDINNISDCPENALFHLHTTTKILCP